MVASAVNGPVISNENVPNGDAIDNLKKGLHQNGNGVMNGSILRNKPVFSKNVRARELMKRNGTLWKDMTFKQLLLAMLAVNIVIFYYLPLTPYLFPVFYPLLLVPVLCGFLGLRNFLHVFWAYSGRQSRINDYIEFVDDEVRTRFSGRFIPIRDLYEFYADGKLDFKGDVLECLEHRDEFVTYKLQWWHLKFYFQKFVPQMFIHDKKQDREQVCDHYNRGNDFYQAFLGPMMIYTSGLQYNDGDTLEDMQANKLREVCNKVCLFLCLFVYLQWWTYIVGGKISNHQKRKFPSPPFPMLNIVIARLSKAKSTTHDFAQTIMKKLLKRKINYPIS